MLPRRFDGLRGVDPRRGRHVKASLGIQSPAVVNESPVDLSSFPSLVEFAGRAMRLVGDGEIERRCAVFRLSIRNAPQGLVGANTACRFPRCLRKAAISAASVVTGQASSCAETSAASSRDRPCAFDEHTTSVDIGSSQCRNHSRRACPTSAILGAANRKRALSAGCNASAILSAVNVSPVPHAITSLPRSCGLSLVKPATTDSIARCGVGDHVPWPLFPAGGRLAWSSLR